MSSLTGSEAPHLSGMRGDVLIGWRGWVGTVTGVVLITVALLPVASLAVWWLARRRRASGAAARPAWGSAVADMGMGYGTVPWVWMILLPLRPVSDVPGRVSLVPLVDVRSVLADGPRTATVQVVGNLLVFFALGFFGPLRFSALRSVGRAVALGAACSVTVEVAQYLLRLDRVSSVDDVLLNAAGAGLAAVCSRRWWLGRSTNVAAGCTAGEHPATR